MADEFDTHDRGTYRPIGTLSHEKL